jgi:hypothetical protein
LVETSGRIGLVAMLVVGAQRAAQKRDNGQVSPATLVLSTLLIAALFNSLGRKVQEAVDRRFYRRNALLKAFWRLLH